MQVVLGLLCALAVGARADYHQEVGIPLAARIKEAEDKIFAVGPNAKSAKIVGGVVSPYNAHPYMAGMIVYLPNNKISSCGASLVSATRLITAAHCWHPNSIFEMVFGSQYLYYGGTRVNTTNVVIHPRYNEYTIANDIAVVYLPRALTYDDNIYPIHLPATSEQMEVIGENALVIGYGLTRDGEKDNSRLRQVYVKVLPEKMCKYHPDYPELGTTICTDSSGGMSSCYGDSGGPLVVTRNYRKILVGVTSYGSQKCEDGHPSVFTRISSFYDFLTQHIQFKNETELIFDAY